MSPIGRLACAAGRLESAIRDRLSNRRLRARHVQRSTPTGSGAGPYARVVPSDNVAERLVDSLNESYGVHPGHRAAHAKGVLCAARFRPTPAAGRLSRAVHLDQGTRAHVRFSNGSGDPTAADGARDGRGMAVKFYLPDGSTTDVVALSLPTFFARTPEDLLAFNAARRVDPETGATDMEAVGAYLAAHPEALTAVNAAITHPVPASYATVTYNSLHAFGFTDAEGSMTWGRYRLVPEAGEAALDDDAAAAAGAGLPARRSGGTVRRGAGGVPMEVVLAGEGDALDDPTEAWPEGRDVVDLGRLELTGLAFDREQGDDVLVFDPTRVPDEIELSKDPIPARPGRRLRRLGGSPHRCRRLTAGGSAGSPTPFSSAADRPDPYPAQDQNHIRETSTPSAWSTPATARPAWCTPATSTSSRPTTASGTRPTVPYVADWERMRSEEAAALDAALWFGEWGGPADQDRFDTYVADVMAMADRQHAGWAYWSWDPGGWGPLTGDHDVSANGELLFRVQPAAIAGTPVDFAWDAADRTFTMTWTERADARSARRSSPSPPRSTPTASTSP